MNPVLIPELDVTDISKSLVFYETVLGFEVLYDRPEEAFAYLTREGAHLMLEQLDGPGRRFNEGELERPFGQGMNLQIQTSSVRLVYDRVIASHVQLKVDLEEKWYRREEGEVGNLQFVVADPDGYLLRFFETLGSRKIYPSTAA